MRLNPPPRGTTQFSWSSMQKQNNVCTFIISFASSLTYSMQIICKYLKVSHTRFLSGWTQKDVRLTPWFSNCRFCMPGKRIPTFSLFFFFFQKFLIDPEICTPKFTLGRRPDWLWSCSELSESIWTFQSSKLFYPLYPGSHTPSSPCPRFICHT